MSLAACIVETRPISDLESIIEKHLNFLPCDTRLYLYLGDQTMHIGGKFPCAIVRSVEINNLHDYNNLLTSLPFWQSFNERKVLIFQSDSMLLRHGIEEFYEWDYVGAPLTMPPWVGNGGLSLRGRDAMIECLTRCPYPVGEWEDLYFGTAMKALGLAIAPMDVAKRFSVESIYEPNPLGYHAAFKYLSNDNLQRLLSNHPQ